MNYNGPLTFRKNLHIAYNHVGFGILITFKFQRQYLSKRETFLINIKKFLSVTVLQRNLISFEIEAEDNK